MWGYIIIVAVTALVSALGGMMSGGSRDGWYAALEKAPYNPPDIAFAIVWPVLYVLMAVGATIVVAKAGGLRPAGRAMGLFFTQLALNLGWSWLFFRFHQPVWSLIDLIALWILIIAMIGAFWRWSKIAALIQIPYLVWVSFAAYLNGFIVYAN